MLHSLSVQNFRSIREKQILSFVASKDDWGENELTVKVAEDVRLHKLCVIWGANASGKSNLLDALNFVRKFWSYKPENKESSFKDRFKEFSPFCLDDDSQDNDTKFVLVFYVENKSKFRYTLELSENVVHLEKLEFFPSIQPAIVFKRVFEDGISKVFFGDKIKVSSAAVEQISLNCLQNMSMFNAYTTVNVKIDLLDNVIDWNKGKWMPPIEPSLSLRKYAEMQINKNEDLKYEVIDFLKKADFNISNITTQEVENSDIMDIILKMKDNNESQEKIDLIKKKYGTDYKTSVTHEIVSNDGRKKNIDLPIDVESSGTKRVFGLISILHFLTKDEKIISIDELESKLHPLLLRYFLVEYLTKSKKSQLIITTHYDGLFDDITEYLRKDNFVFVEKDKETAASIIKPLINVKGLNRITSLRKAYLKNKLGAVPVINIDQQLKLKFK